jgi:CheY-like chemotaxis protein
VLVVDDEPAMRRVSAAPSRRKTFTLKEATDGESALRLIQSRTEPFDLVLTDLSMPLIRWSTGLRDADAVESSDIPVRVMLQTI